MKKSVYFSLALALIVMLVASCSFGGFTEEKYSDSQLIGRWTAPSASTIDPEGEFQYWVFQSEKDDEGEFRYGYTWDMGDHTDWDYSEGDYEQFLLTEEYHGNGWFKWKIDGKELHLYHFMSYGWAEIPKVYTITNLTSSTLTYKDSFGKSFTFTKGVE